MPDKHFTTELHPQPRPVHIFLFFFLRQVSQCWWLTPVIPPTQEAKIRRIEVQSQPRQIVHKPLSQKTHHKNRAGGVDQGAGPEFKSQYGKKKKKKMFNDLD
jgi:hypothetical protein